MPLKQLPLFPSPDRPSWSELPTHVAEPGLNADTPLAEAVVRFEPAMRRKGFTQNTINSFLGDMRLLSRYLGGTRPIGRISLKDLNAFLEYLAYDRGVPCNPKSYERRITTLKVFFTWLVETEAIHMNPAAALVHHPISTPLPRILSEEEIIRLSEAGQRLRTAEKPDVRPLFLFELLLDTGIKKAECMALKLSDVDISDPHNPSIFVRYESGRQRYKERRLATGPRFLELYREYRSQYHPQIRLFECTPRNLEYVLRDLALESGMKTPVSFEMLRMTCAVRDFRRGMPSEALRVKLGLSRVSWEETGPKIERLASAPL